MDVAYLIATLSPLSWPLFTTIGGLIHAVVTRHRQRDLLELWIRWWLVGGMSLGALTIAGSFSAAPRFMADSMGYATGPYQFEVSVTNLAFAVMGLLCLRVRKARLTVIIGFAVFMWGAAFGHIFQTVAHGNHTAGNTGGILVYDFGLPLLLLVLVWRQRVTDRTEAAAPRLGRAPSPA